MTFLIDTNRGLVEGPLGVGSLKKLTLDSIEMSRRRFSIEASGGLTLERWHAAQKEI